MICTTIREDVECAFMTKEGCGFNGGQCHTIVEQCEGCKSVVDFPSGKYCRVSPDPGGKWAFGPCNLASHLDRKKVVADRKINPLKASKRAQKAG